jgi:hypothetical protein
MTRPENVLLRPVSALRRWVTAFALLAFFIQGLAVQTHIHAPAPAAKVTTSSQATPSKAPLKAQDPIDQCRLCQELVHAGVFLAPSTSTAPVSLTFITAVFITLPDAAVTSATDFAWQSRAPPRH